MDEGVRGLERLKRAPDLDSDTVDKVRVLFEAGRADINSHFCNNLEGAETVDAEEPRGGNLWRRPGVGSILGQVSLRTNPKDLRIPGSNG